MGTVTEEGTTAFALLLVRDTFKPFEGAGLLIVTVPVACDPPFTDDGLTEILRSSGEMIRNVADAEVDPSFPFIVAAALVATADVVIVKVAVLEPLFTVTYGGTTAFGFADVRLIVFPLALAVAVRVTVPVELVPPGTDAGETLILLSDWARRPLATPTKRQTLATKRLTLDRMACEKETAWRFVVILVCFGR